jgi:hypothetical protein
MVLWFLPVFIDISNFRLILFGGHEPEAAVHLGYFFVCLAITSKILVSLFRNRLVRSDGVRILLFFFLMTASLLFSDINITIAIQFLSIIIFFPIGVLSIKRYVFFLFRFSMLCNSILLIIYIVINVILPEQFNPIIIYQGLVSFPATLILYVYTLLCFLPVIIRKKNRFIFHLIWVQIAMCSFIVLNLGRKIGLIDLLVLSGVIVFVIVHFGVRRDGTRWLVKHKWLAIVVSLSLPIVYVCIDAFVNSNIFARLAGASEERDLDGSRLSNWAEGLAVTFGTPKSLFFGADITSMRDSNFHNYFLDMSVRFGLPIAIIIIGSLYLAFRFSWVQAKDDRYYKVLLVAIFCNIFLHSMVNSALSQSLYVTSLVVALAAVNYCAVENFRWRSEPS